MKYLEELCGVWNLFLNVLSRRLDVGWGVVVIVMIK